MNDVQSIESTLNDREMEIVRYHRRTIARGEVGKDSEGRPVTVYSNTIQIPEGPHEGQFVTVPGYFDGEMHDDEGEIWKKWRGEILNGKWPIYGDPKEADGRAKHIHGIMDIESDMNDPSIRLYGETP